MTQEAKSTLPANIRDLLQAEAAGMAQRISGPGGDLIKVSQDKKFTFPDGTVSAGPFEAVIVDFVSANYLYEGAYNPQQMESPICFAIGPQPKTLVPSANSTNKQAESCEECPNNQFGSGGGNGKACKNHRLVALLPTKMDAETPLMVLRVSPGAIKHFDKYVAQVTQVMQDDGSPTLMQQVITTVGFDPGETYPSLRFGKPSRLPDGVWESFAARYPEARKRLTTEPDMSRKPEAKPATRQRPRR